MKDETVLIFGILHSSIIVTKLKFRSQEYQEAVAKLQQEFDDKLRRGQVELEEAIAREKAEKEAERLKTEKIQQEMVSIIQFISLLHLNTQNLNAQFSNNVQ